MSFHVKTLSPAMKQALARIATAMAREQTQAGGWIYPAERVGREGTRIALEERGLIESEYVGRLGSAWRVRATVDGLAAMRELGLLG